MNKLLFFCLVFSIYAGDMGRTRSNSDPRQLPRHFYHQYRITLPDGKGTRYQLQVPQQEEESGDELQHCCLCTRSKRVKIALLATIATVSTSVISAIVGLTVHLTS